MQATNFEDPSGVRCSASQRQACLVDAFQFCPSRAAQVGAPCCSCPAATDWQTLPCTAACMWYMNIVRDGTRCFCFCLADGDCRRASPLCIYLRMSPLHLLRMLPTHRRRAQWCGGSSPHWTSSWLFLNPAYRRLLARVDQDEETSDSALPRANRCRNA
jgi:hypothetical protein